MNPLAETGLRRPRAVVAASVLLSLLVLLAAAVPSIWPDAAPFLNGVRVDTDPENMLADDEPVRVFHREKKEEFALYDQIVVGVVREEDGRGVFTPEVLANVDELVRYAQGIDGVIAPQILSPSTIDNIEQAGLGAVSFEWLMPAAPADQREADAVRDKLMRLPMMRGSLVSEDGTALMLSIPIEAKDRSHEVSAALLEKIGTFDPASGESWHITGLPVANDTFGVEMFKQMAISAPVAMLLIFVLMLLFFRRVRLVVAPMIVALLSVVLTMGLLVITGNTVHIMSSMIPIFIMPIAVLDAVHILSEFYDRYPQFKDKKRTIRAVVETLWRPMLFTSLTTAAGFGSLALAPIPPVQVFGIFVAVGVLAAWVLTVLFIPAYIMLMDERKLEGFGFAGAEREGSVGGVLGWMAGFTRRRAVWILGAALVLAGVAAYGISLIRINDNPVKWFEQDHRIRVADAILNERFAGTYPAYLHLSAENADSFKDPELLAWVEELQRHAEASPLVGKTQSLADLVKTVYRELLGGEEENYRVPGSAPAVAQTVLTYESSHRPEDVYHLVTPDFEGATVWFQLKSGDNADMSAVVERIEDYIADNPPPAALETDWFGLTYINVVWQEKMVAGMLESLVSSFAVVFLLMALLFRSFLWGLLAMIPLTVTIGLIYGVIGLIGKDYDMPVAVLSSLSLGLAVDYAIHFLARSRELRGRNATWTETLGEMFGEPARAISRNIVVVGVGFLPLILAPLVPYQTVGYLISSILLVAGAATLFLLPALQTVLRRFLFPEDKPESRP